MNNPSLIENRLEQLLTVPEIPEAILFQAARYSTLNGGKRLRPLLTLATTAALNGDVQAALDPACALEFIHSYSLIHDDLPCMDNDDYRRGRLTTHKQFDEATALLAGDYLLTYAFGVLAEAPHLTSDQKIRLITTLSHRAGGEGMIGGQILDLQSSHLPIPIERLELIHRKKSAELLICSIEFGGIIAGASHQQMQDLREFGAHLGLAFQIIDDVIDVVSSEIKHGKETSSDEVNGKMTYVSLLGIDEARQTADRLLHLALLKLTALPSHEPLEFLARSLVERTR